MTKNMIIYRGKLKSCNYHCSYCPFSKHQTSVKELEKDKECWMKFCDSIEQRADILDIGAVFVTPYGEALLHHWYWEGLARLSCVEGIEKAGVQTNASFLVEHSLKIFTDFKGKIEKLCIWATFHPEMTNVDSFVLQCKKLIKQGVSLSVGAVGVPENIEVIQNLREKLPKNIYLWINKMDGLKRNYTDNEIKIFTKIDPFFVNELNYPKASASMCDNRCFVEANGQIRSCNISAIKPINWYENDFFPTSDFFQENFFTNGSFSKNSFTKEFLKEKFFSPVCLNRRCSCYLAYAGRTDFCSKNFFGDYPIFRIPTNSKTMLCSEIN